MTSHFSSPARLPGDGKRRPATAGRDILRYWGPAVAYMAVIFTLSSMPDPLSVPGHFSDKTLHAWLYAGLAVLLVRAVVGSRWPRTGLPSALLAVGLATVYGLADETHQLFVPGRQFDLRDLVADAIGAGVAAAAVFAWGIITRFRRLPSGRS